MPAWPVEFNAWLYKILVMKLSNVGPVKPGVVPSHAKREAFVFRSMEIPPSERLR